MKIFYWFLWLLIKVCVILGTIIFLIITSPIILLGLINDEVEEEQMMRDMNEAISSNNV